MSERPGRVRWGFSGFAGKLDRWQRATPSSGTGQGREKASLGWMKHCPLVRPPA